MIVVDASAIVAILLEEPNFEALAAKIRAADAKVVSPVSSLEVIMALTRAYKAPMPIVDGYLLQNQIAIQAIGSDEARWAQFAFLTYGKGRHPARLNLGDCFSYAAAKASNVPLLYVGQDFAKTDIRAA